MDVEKPYEQELCEPVTNHFVFEKSDSDYVYLKVSIENSSERDAERDPVFLKNLLLKSMAENFGEANRLVPVDFLKFDPIANVGIIRCNSMIFQRLTSSILINNSKLNYLKIQKVAYNNPSGLMFSSRGYSHCFKNRKKRNIKAYN